MDRFSNNSTTTLTGNVDGSTNPVTLNVANPSGFPSRGPFRIVIDNEILAVTAGWGTTSWTASRAQDGTTISAHTSGAVAYHILTAFELNSFRQDYNVVAYGAKGDGATDDTTAIQAAINAAIAAGGGIVFFPSGTYVVSTITYGQYVRLEGVGTYGSLASRITQKAGTAAPILTEPGAAYPYYGVGITGLAFDASSNAASNAGGIRLRGTPRAMVRDCRIAQTNTYGIEVIGGGANTTGDTMYVNIIGNVIENLNSGAIGVYLTVPALNGSHPDGCVITHNLFNIGAGTTALKADCGGFNTSGADAIYFAFNRVEECPIPIDVITQGASFIANRLEIVATPSMTINVNVGPAAFPSGHNAFIGNEYATGGNPALLTFNDNGATTQRIGEGYTGGQNETRLRSGMITPFTSRGLYSLGDIFDGSTAGHFAGVAGGTYLALNAKSGFTGSLIDLQTAGSSMFSISGTGAATVANGLTVSASGVTVTGQSIFTASGATLQLKSAGAGAAARIHFFDLTTEKWELGKEADNHFFLWDSVNSRYALNAWASTGIEVPVNDFTVTAGKIVIGTAVSQIVPGATSMSLRNHANNADNLILTDAGAATIRAGLTVSAGGASITGALTHTPSAASVAAESNWLSQGAQTLTITAGFTTERFNLFNQPTISGAFTVTNTATVAITGAPAAAGGATLTNAWALWTQAGASLIDGAPTATANYGQLSLGQVWDGASANHFVGSANGTFLAINGASGFAGRYIDAQLAGVSQFFVNSSRLVFTPSSSVGNGISPFFIQPAGNTSITAETIVYNLAGNTTTITGGYATQRFAVLAQPTISGAFTITNAATLAIAGAPIAAGGATLTNNYAVWVQGGASRFDGALLSASASAAIGYATGQSAGGAVTQLTSKSTGVSQNTPTGAITMNNASLAANTTVTFTLTNTAIAATDVLYVQLKSGNATAATYQVWCDSIAAGSAVIAVRNVSAGALAEALVLNYVVVKGSAN